MFLKILLLLPTPPQTLSLDPFLSEVIIWFYSTTDIGNWQEVCVFKNAYTATVKTPLSLVLTLPGVLSAPFQKVPQLISVLSHSDKLCGLALKIRVWGLNYVERKACV